jgi:AraC-like DNA-binding protein
LMHDQPGQPWTLARLSQHVGYSRASIVRRFTELVGQPPMAYLTEWRLTLAADLLLSSDDTVESVGRQVGYDNPFAFSSAFKRLHASSPRAFRLAGSSLQAPASL